MKNCNCEPKYVPGRRRIPHDPPCPYQGGEPIPPFKPTPKSACGCKPSEVTLRTVPIPANLGDDTGEYAPKPGAYFNTIVQYIANDAVYIYDSNGVFTKIYPDDYAKLIETVDGFEQAMNELYNPGKIGLIVKTNADLEALSPTAVVGDEYVYVAEDAAHNNRPSLYEYSASAGEYVYVRAASPYYEKPFIDSAIENLQANINNVMNKEIEDVDNLQTNINAEVNARTEAVADLDQRIEDIVNSPDVRYIVETYADLEAIDKSTIGDQDYARVLQDETHEDASTYYQFNKTASEWTYVGQTGPYYTKEQVDEKVDSLTSEIEGIDTTKLNGLANIKTIGENLTLTSAGVLNATGGGSLPDNISFANNSTSINATLSGTLYNTIAIGGAKDEFGMGEGASASGANSIAIGGSATRGSLALGTRASATANGLAFRDMSMAIGTEAQATNGGEAIGHCATATHAGAVALGFGATTTAEKTLDIAYSDINGGNPTPVPRRITHVGAGEDDTDAVNMSQLNAALARIVALETKLGV